MKNKSKQDLYYNLWIMLDKARDVAYLVGNEKDIITISKLRRKYLHLSEVGDKIIKQINKELVVNKK
jgi:hypothetical protein